MRKIKQIKGRGAGRIGTLSSIHGTKAIVEFDGWVEDGYLNKYSYDLNHPIVEDIPDNTLVRLTHSTFVGGYTLVGGIFLHRMGAIMYQGSTYGCHGFIEKVDLDVGDTFIIINNNGDTSVSSAFVNGIIREVTKIDLDGDGKIWFKSKGEDKFVRPWNIYITTDEIAPHDYIKYRGHTYEVISIEGSEVKTSEGTLPLVDCTLHRKRLPPAIGQGERVSINIDNTILQDPNSIYTVSGTFEGILNIPMSIVESATNMYIPSWQVSIYRITERHIFIPSVFNDIINLPKDVTNYSIKGYALFEHTQTKVQIIAKGNKRDRGRSRKFSFRPHSNNFIVEGVIVKFSTELYEEMGQLFGSLYMFRQLTEDEVYGFIMKRKYLNPNKNHLKLLN